jgi:hypothetical protein
MEIHMSSKTNDTNIDYITIQAHIRAARLEQSVAVGKLIANGLVSAWSGTRRVVARLAHLSRWIGQPARDYTTAMPRQF